MYKLNVSQKTQSLAIIAAYGKLMSTIMKYDIKLESFTIKFHKQQLQSWLK